MFMGKCEECQNGPRVYQGRYEPSGIGDWVRLGWPVKWGHPQSMKGWGWVCGTQVLREKGNCSLGMGLGSLCV